MPHVSASKGAGAILGLAAAIFAAGFIVNGIDDRDDTWAHAAATTGGDPSSTPPPFISAGMAIPV
jgi:hypothetical protein